MRPGVDRSSIGGWQSGSALLQCEWISAFRNAFQADVGRCCAEDAALAAEREQATVSHLEVNRINLDADRVSSRLRGGDAGGARAHERVKNGVSSEGQH